jgi:membrane protease YdiL (CAAX protease family)
MEDLLSYSLRITPGLILITVVFFLLPKKQIASRIFLLILGFILMRDAMTPAGFWEFGRTDTAFWLRFVDDAFTLVTLGGLSVVVAFLLLQLKELRALVRWGATRSWETYIAGALGGIFVAAPFMLLSTLVPIEERGGEVALSLVPALLVLAFAGNFLEELIFRGFLQGYFEKVTNSIRAAFLSGLIFAVAHVFLASTVTDLGWPLLLFVTVEGLMCAFVYRKYGLISASIVHGLAIFLLASGLA